MRQLMHQVFILLFLVKIIEIYCGLLLKRLMSNNLERGEISK